MGGGRGGSGVPRSPFGPSISPLRAEFCHAIGEQTGSDGTGLRSSLSTDGHAAHTTYASRHCAFTLIAPSSLNQHHRHHAGRRCSEARRGHPRCHPPGSALLCPGRPPRGGEHIRAIGGPRHALSRQPDMRWGVGVWKNSTISLAPGTLIALVDPSSPAAGRQEDGRPRRAGRCLRRRDGVCRPRRRRHRECGQLQQKHGQTTRLERSYSISHQPDGDQNQSGMQCLLMGLNILGHQTLAPPPPLPPRALLTSPPSPRSLPALLAACLQVKATVCASNPTAKICLKDSAK